MRTKVGVQTTASRMTTWRLIYSIVLPECFGILKDLGVEEKLRIMEEDPERDVRDRARTALSQLTSLSDMQEE
jgi:hypothetical protein